MRQDDEYHPNYMAADLLPHEFDGSYGFLEPSYLSHPPMGRPAYSNPLLPRLPAESQNQGALHMIPTTPSHSERHTSLRNLSVCQSQPPFQYPSGPDSTLNAVSSHRAQWPPSASVNLNLLESQVLEAPLSTEHHQGLGFLLHGQLKESTLQHNAPEKAWLPMMPQGTDRNTTQQQQHARDSFIDHKTHTAGQIRSGGSSHPHRNSAIARQGHNREAPRIAVVTPSSHGRKRPKDGEDYDEEHWRRPRAGQSQRAERHADVGPVPLLEGLAPVKKPSNRSNANMGSNQGSKEPTANLHLQDTSGRKKEHIPSDSRASRSKSSNYRGVTRHRRSGRYEAHLWIKELHRQVYLGGYEHEEHAAEAYDVAALKSKGMHVKTNFDIARYADLTACMHSISLEELIMAVRRQSQGFSRGSSSFRGVTHHPSGRWEARIGIPGSKHIYLGLHNDEDSAARAYDSALVRLRGVVAATNFSLSEYRVELADYHRKQQALLEGSQPERQVDGEDFEDWIKNGYGSMASKPTSAMETSEISSRGTVASEDANIRKISEMGHGKTFRPVSKDVERPTSNGQGMQTHEERPIIYLRRSQSLGGSVDEQGEQTARHITGTF